MFAGGLGTSLAERQVVLAAAALVAVALDADVLIRPLSRLIEEILKRGPRSRRELRGVVVEVDARGRDVRRGSHGDGLRRELAPPAAEPALRWLALAAEWEVAARASRPRGAGGERRGIGGIACVRTLRRVVSRCACSMDKASKAPAPPRNRMRMIRG
jgi:hypothetical protein